MNAPAAPPIAAARRLKIVHVITRFIRGGAEENTLLTCNGQAALGHDVTLIYGDEFHPAMPPRLDARIAAVREPSLVREISPLKDARCLASLTKRFRAMAPDVVHTHESKAGILGRAAAKAAGTPLVVHGVHILAHLNAGPAQAALYRTADWIAGKGTDLFINVSEGMRDACLEAGMGRADQHVIVESGMELLDFSAAQPMSAAGIAAAARFAPEAPRFVLIAGALEARKRVAEFLDVFAEAAAAHSDLCLLIAGEGPERGNVEARIAALGLQGRAACIGHQSDLGRWIATTDFCVHCAAREGLPRVAVQFVAGGKPLIITALPGIERIVSDGANGFITDLNDLGAMRAPLMALAGDADLRARMSAAARAINLSAWSRERMVARIEEAYQHAAAKSARLAIA
ncbi:MAG: glycosyltransferase [Hyphomonadaceae bacterium]